MKLYTNWSVSLFREEIYIVTINVINKNTFVGRLNNEEFYIEDENEEEIIKIPEFLPIDKKYMSFDSMNKDQYSCVYIPYSLEDLKTRKIILQNES